MASVSAADLNATDIVAVENEEIISVCEEDAVSVDDTENIISSYNDDELSVTNDSEVLGTTCYVNPGDSLSSKIGSASSGDTLIIKGGTYSISDYSITKALTFIGEGNVIFNTGGRSDKVMFFIKEKISFKNITFQGANAQWGSVFYVGSGYLTVDNCTFKNNWASKGGSAVYCTSSGRCRISNSYFTKCNTGQIGGALRIGTSCWLTNCTFEDCAAESAAAIHMRDSYMSTIEDCTFKNCHSTNYGGAIDCSIDGKSSFNDLKISRCSFINCYCENNKGGAISADAAKNLEILDCFFESCYSKKDMGGAIRLDTANGARVDNCTFVKCHSTNGGAIHVSNQRGNSKNVVINNSNFKDCYATKYGGGVDIYSANNVDILNSNFTNCYVNDYRGGAISGDSVNDINISSCNFDSCRAAEWGGGAVRLDETSKINIENSKFINNTSPYGGAIRLGEFNSKYCSDAQITNCEFINNSASETGGAIFNDRVTNIDITGCLFESCYSKVSSGAIDFEGAVNAKVESSQFNNCNSSIGGAIYLHSGARLTNNVIINKSIFTNNIANEGGSIQMGGGSGILIQDCNFENSTSLDAGGSIGSNNVDNIKIINSTFENSQSIQHRGGALRVYYSNKIDIDGCSFNNCNSNKSGGAVVFGNSKVSINNSDFTNNHCFQDAGAILIFTSEVEITDTNFINNSASGSYGAIYVKNDEDGGSSINMDKCKFEKCSDSQNGDALRFESDVTYDVCDSNFDVIPSKLNLHYNPTIEANNLSILQGETGTLNVRLSNSQNPLSYKTVTLTLNGKSDSRSSDKNGNVQFVVNNFIFLVGEYEGTLSFAGDDLNSEVSKTVKVKINSYIGKLEATQAGKYWEDTSLTFKLTNSNTGEVIPYANIRVTFSNGQEIDLQTDKNGVTNSYKVPFAPAKYTYVARVVDKNVEVNTVENDLTIYSINGAIEISQYGRIFKFKAYNPENGDVFRNIKLNLQFSGVDSDSVKTNDEGMATYNFPDKKGTYNLLVTVNGNQYMEFAPAEMKNIVISTEYDPSLNDAVYSKIIFGDPIVFDYMKSGSTNMVLVGGSIGSVSVSGHLEAKWSYKNNILTVSNLPVGTYTLRVVTNPHDNHYSTEASIKITVNKVTAVVKASKITTVLKKGNLWKVTIVDSKTGKAIKGLKLTFKVYTGKKYKTVTRTTNSKGEATYQTKSLSKGTHKVVVSSTHEGYKLNIFTSSIKVVKQTALKFKVKRVSGVKDGDSISITVINKKTKKPLNGVKIKLLIKNGKKYKTVILKSFKKGKYKGVCGYATNKLSVGKHTVKIVPVSIKYKGSAKSVMKITKMHKKKPAWETKDSGK